VNLTDLYAELKALGLCNGLMLVLYFHFVVFPLISNAVAYIRATAARVGVQPGDLVLQAAQSAAEQELFTSLAKAALASGGVAAALSAASGSTGNAAAQAAQGAPK
jgi:hypothetical protein